MDNILKLIVEDSLWRYSKTAKPNRGLHDYERVIGFNSKLSDDQLRSLISYFDNSKTTPFHYPGLCGQLTEITGQSYYTYWYKFTCFCDSSD